MIDREETTRAIVRAFEARGWLTNPESTGYAYVNMIKATAAAEEAVKALQAAGFLIMRPARHGGGCDCADEPTGSFREDAPRRRLQRPEPRR